jgi:hypothetical protein
MTPATHIHIPPHLISHATHLVIPLSPKGDEESRAEWHCPVCLYEQCTPSRMGACGGPRWTTPKSVPLEEAALDGRPESRREAREARGGTLGQDQTIGGVSLGSTKRSRAALEAKEGKEKEEEVKRLL